MLVVADLESNADLLGALSEPLPTTVVSQTEVLSSTGGDEAIELFQVHQPHVVVVTASLETGDTAALIDAVRGLRARPEVAIVVIGDREGGAIRTAEDASALDPDRFVPRPMTPRALRLAAASALEAVIIARSASAPSAQPDALAAVAAAEAPAVVASVPVPAPEAAAVPEAGAPADGESDAARAALRQRWETLADSIVYEVDLDEEVVEVEEEVQIESEIEVGAAAESPPAGSIESPSEAVTPVGEGDEVAEAAPLPPPIAVRARVPAAESDSAPLPQPWSPGTTSRIESPWSDEASGVPVREPTLFIRDPSEMEPPLPPSSLPPVPPPPPSRVQAGPDEAGALQRAKPADEEGVSGVPGVPGASMGVGSGPAVASAPSAGSAEEAEEAAAAQARLDAARLGGVARIEPPEDETASGGAPESAAGDASPSGAATSTAVAVAPAPSAAAPFTPIPAPAARAPTAPPVPPPPAVTTIAARQEPGRRDLGPNRGTVPEPAASLGGSRAAAPGHASPSRPGQPRAGRDLPDLDDAPSDLVLPASRSLDLPLDSFGDDLILGGSTGRESRLEVLEDLPVPAPAAPSMGDGRDFARQLRAKMSQMAQRLFQGADTPAPAPADLAPRHDHSTEIDLASLGEELPLGGGTEHEARAGARLAIAPELVAAPGSWDSQVRERGLPEQGDIVRGVSDAAMLLAKMFAGGSTGRIMFRRGEVETVVFFDQGRPVFASSSEARDRMGALLVREGKITASQYERCQSMVAESGRRMGEILVDLGYLKRRELLPAVRRHVEDLVYALFGWDSGRYHISIEAQPCAERIRLSRHPASLILEGVRRKLNRTTLERLLGPPSTVIEVGDRDRLGGIINMGDLSSEERAALAAFDGQADLAAVARTAGVDIADVLPIAWGLCVLGLATARRADTEIPDEGTALVGETDLAIDRERVRARWQLVSEADYFALLGVRRDATAFEIRRAYQAARRDFAADGFPSDLRTELARELDDIACVLDEAFRVLRDDRLRQTYLANLIE